MNEELDFEATMAELERIVSALDREELDLDEALRLFEDGVRHVRRANELLDAARGRIEELIETSSGEIRTADLEIDEEASEDD
ncbi:MAG: exodeoxyribonuclease VII small subunit [Gemmatimonadota bacterium]|jgi:exodeoxyribonuclease VII small subunit|nr:MAG: exodeoxyribonuclease VII small subunit [Gemmatimonadota bacterium]